MDQTMLISRRFPFPTSEMGKQFFADNEKIVFRFPKSKTTEQRMLKEPQIEFPSEFQQVQTDQNEKSISIDPPEINWNSERTANQVYFGGFPCPTLSSGTFSLLSH
jgi:hypothetical protein